MTNNELRAWCEAEIAKCTKYGFSPEHEGKALALREVLTRIETNSRTGEPTAWMYAGPGGQLQFGLKRAITPLDWTGTPLYAVPQSITPPEVGGEQEDTGVAATPPLSHPSGRAQEVSGKAGIPNAEWREVSAATKPGRYIAVVDRPLLCSWYFATFDGSDWFDMSSGKQILITHWMPFPAGPSGSRP